METTKYETRWVARVEEILTQYDNFLGEATDGIDREWSSLRETGECKTMKRDIESARRWYKAATRVTRSLGEKMDESEEKNKEIVR